MITGLRDVSGMTPREAGAYLASLEPPISDEQAKAAARILAHVEPEMKSA